MKRRLLSCLLLLWAVHLCASAARASGQERQGSITVLLPGGEMTLFSVELTQEAKLTPEYAKLLEAELAGTEGVRRRVVDGSVFFSDLEQGVYLICQTGEAPGYQDICPFFVPIPLMQGEEWIYDVCACPKTDPLPEDPLNPDTGQSSLPLFLMRIGAAGGAVMLGVKRSGLRDCCL